MLSKNFIDSCSKLIEELYRTQVSNDKGVYLEAENEGTSPEAVDQYSVVRGKNQTPYSKYYSEELREISILILEELKNNATLKDFEKDFLSSYLKATESNEWLSAEKQFVKSYLNSSSQDLINIGPIESMSDKRYGVHRYFSFLYMRVDEELSSEINQLLLELPSFLDQIQVKGFINPPKIKVCVGDTDKISGEIGLINPAGWSRPESQLIAQEEGTIKQLYANNTLKKVEEIYIPLAKQLIRSEDAEILIKFMREQYVKVVALHEISHTIAKYPGYRERLGKCYNSLEEIKTDFVAYKLAAHLETKGLLQKNFTRFMVYTNFIVDMHMRHIFKTTNIREAYYHLSLQFWRSFKQFFNSKPVEIEDLDIAIILRNVDMMLDELLPLFKDGPTKDIEKFMSNLLEEEKSLSKYIPKLNL